MRKYEYRKLRGRIKELYGSQEKFAEAINHSTNYVSEKIRGRTQFSQADVEMWAEALKIDKNDYGEFFYT